MFNKMVTPTGGGEQKLLKQVGHKQATPSSNTVVSFNLSDIDGAENFVLYENMMPSIYALPYGGSASNITLTYTFTYDPSTKILQLVLGEHTSYIHFSNGGVATIDIYALA